MEIPVLMGLKDRELERLIIQALREVVTTKVSPVFISTGSSDKPEDAAIVVLVDSWIDSAAHGPILADGVKFINDEYPNADVIVVSSKRSSDELKAAFNHYDLNVFIYLGKGANYVNAIKIAVDSLLLANRK